MVIDFLNFDQDGKVDEIRESMYTQFQREEIPIKKVPYEFDILVG